MMTVTTLAVQQCRVSAAHDASVSVERADWLIHESHRVLSKGTALNRVAGGSTQSGFVFRHSNVPHSASSGSRI
jgi:hypothetical protein